MLTFFYKYYEYKKLTFIIKHNSAMDNLNKISFESKFNDNSDLLISNLISGNKVKYYLF